jgi:hypothetical protein
LSRKHVLDCFLPVVSECRRRLVDFGEIAQLDRSMPHKVLSVFAKESSISIVLLGYPTKLGMAGLPSYEAVYTLEILTQDRGAIK